MFMLPRGYDRETERENQTTRIQESNGDLFPKQGKAQPLLPFLYVGGPPKTEIIMKKKNKGGERENPSWRTTPEETGL